MKLLIFYYRPNVKMMLNASSTILIIRLGVRLESLSLLL